jgi:serine/threonine protein phosphatase PrpC
VSRTFGDFEGKLPQLGTGGIRGVVSSDPEIGCVEIGNFWDEENEDNKKIANYCDNIFEPSIGKDADFLIVGCDGVFDRLESEQIVEKCWKGLRAKFSPESE